MTITINLSNLHIFDGGIDKGHIIDAVRGGEPTVDGSEAKAALDLAWIAKGEIINDHLRAIADKQTEISALKDRSSEAEARAEAELALRIQSV